MKKTKEKIELKIFYTNYADKIKVIKEEIVSDFKTFMTEKFGFVFIAEWLDLREASIYCDKFLARIDDNLYRINMSHSQGGININSVTFRRFDTINLLKVRGEKEAYGYYINEDGTCVNKLEKNKHPHLYSYTYSYLYRDLLRKNKIQALLNNE